MDDFGAGALQNPAHDVDGGVMPVKQAGRGDEPNRRIEGEGFGPISSRIWSLCGFTRLFGSLFALGDGNDSVCHGSGSYSCPLILNLVWNF